MPGDRTTRASGMGGLTSTILHSAESDRPLVDRRARLSYTVRRQHAAYRRIPPVPSSLGARREPSFAHCFAVCRPVVCDGACRRRVWRRAGGCPAAGRSAGRLGPRQSLPRNDAHPGAHLHQWPVALATGRLRRSRAERRAARRPMGLSESSRRLARLARLHVVGHRPALSASGLGKDEAERDEVRLVRARDHRAGSLERPRHLRRCRVGSIERRRLSRRQARRQHSLSGRQSERDFALQARRETGLVDLGCRLAAFAGDDFLFAFQRLGHVEGRGGAARPGGRRFSGKRSRRGPSRRRQIGPFGAQVGTGRRCRRGQPRRRSNLSPQRRSVRRRQARPRLPERRLQGGRCGRRPVRDLRALEAAEALGHQRAGQHVHAAVVVDRRPGARARHAARGAVRLSRVLGRRPRFPPQRHAFPRLYCPLRRAADVDLQRQLRRREGVVLAAEGGRLQPGLQPPLQQPAGRASGLRGDSARPTTPAC